MTRAGATTNSRSRNARRRSRDRWGAAAVVALALVAGLLAAHFGTHRSWERPSSSLSTTTVPSSRP